MIKPQSVDELNASIVDQHGHLSDRLTLVARYVVEHPRQIALNTLAQIANSAGVHPSTLVRFANHFGFSGFSELQRHYKQRILDSQGSYSERIRQLKLAEATRPEMSASNLLGVFSEASQLSLSTLQQQINLPSLESAIDLLSAADNIHVCGIRRAYPVSSFFYYSLNQMEVRCQQIDGHANMLTEQLQWLDKTSALIAITFHPYSQFTGRAIQHASDNGAPIVLITDSELSPMASVADTLLIVREAEVHTFRSLTATLCLAQSLCVALGYRQQEKASQPSVES